MADVAVEILEQAQRMNRMNCPSVLEQILPGSVSGGTLNPVIGLGLALTGGGLRNALATWLGDFL